MNYKQLLQNKLQNAIWELEDVVSYVEDDLRPYLETEIYPSLNNHQSDALNEALNQIVKWQYEAEWGGKVFGESITKKTLTSDQRRWISVKDRLPDSDGNYLCYYGYDKTGHCHAYKMHMGCLDYFANDKEPHWQHSGVGLFVTHWRELPEPPESNVEEQV